MRWPMGLGVAGILVVAALGQGPAARVKTDAPFKPTPPEVVARMLELAAIRPDDVLYDLGCGDGRIVIEAAKRYGIKAVGFDIDPARVRESRENVAKAGVGDLVTIRQADIFRADLTGASVVTLYLLPNLNVRLMPQLARLKPGSRIVSNSFGMKGARPARMVKVPQDRGLRVVYLWVVPWAAE